jgi:hypothetical protein
MHDNGRIDKIVEIAELPDGGSFEEFMPFETGTLAEGLARHKEDGLLLDGQHVFPQKRAHGTVTRGIKGRTEAGIKPGLSILRENTGIKLRLVPFTVTEEIAGTIVHMTIEFIFAGGLIADGDSDGIFLVQHIVQIIPAVGAAGDIRGVKACTAEGIVRIVCFFIDNAFIPPISQIIHRSGPADIVVQTENVAAETIMGSIDVEAAVEDVRFAVGGIFPGRKVRVKSLHLHNSP